ncbi:MAG: HlyD family secretion protein [Saprospiraceae bacterium]|jgi:HlyD family secretion protein
MDRHISGNEINKSKMLTYLKYLLILGVLVAAIYFFRQFLTKKAERKDFYIVNVEKGDIQNTLTATGTVVPSMEREINSPVTTEIKKVIKGTGEYVKNGDMILELDQEFTRLEYDQLDDELKLKRNNVDKLKLEYDKNLRDLDYQNQIKSLQLDELTAQVKDQERLRDVGGATAEEVEQAELQLKVAKLEKSMLENELGYRQSVNVNEKRGLELEYTIQEKKLAELSRKLRETKVRAPQEGVITWINEDIGRKVTEGETLVRIANLEKFRVEASSSDRNSNKIDVGMPVKVRINRKDLTGYISTILPALENNTIKFHVQLDEPDSELLRPNIRAEVFIITDNKTGVIRVKNGPGFKGASSQYIYVLEGNKAVRRRITKGLTNSDFVEITDNLIVGEQVIISDMKDYDHLEEFIIQE